MNQPDATRELGVEFVDWPAYCFCTAPTAVVIGEDLPGAHGWLGETRSSLSSETERDLLVLLLTGALEHVLALHYEAGHLDQPIPEFMQWLEDLDALDLAASCDLSSKWEPCEDGGRRTNLGTDSNLADWAGIVIERSVWDRAELVIAEPERLHRLLVSTLRVFWEGHFRRAYEVQRAETQETLELLRKRYEGKPASEVVPALVGRAVPGVESLREGTQKFLAIPVFYLGPYLSESYVDEDMHVRVEAFDPATARAQLDVSPIRENVSRIKALADETRIRILRFLDEGERYGGEIVEYVGLTQPAVSRHLRLLVAAGLLNVRQEGTAKFYSLDRQRLDATAEFISQLANESREPDGDPQ